MNEEMTSIDKKNVHKSIQDEIRENEDKNEKVLESGNNLKKKQSFNEEGFTNEIKRFMRI